MQLQKGFTLIELLVVIAIVGVLAAIVLLAINPARIIENANYQTTVANLNQIAKATQMYEIATGQTPPDANRNIPTEFLPYLGPGIWPKGPFEGSVYDWDNWLGQTCHNGRPGGTQITLRDISRYQGQNYSTLSNPISGRPQLAIYMQISGTNALPHCSNTNVVGICINCESLFPPN